MSGETLFVQGNEACARGALYAGLKFFAGYPITPSTEIAETLAELLPRVGGNSLCHCRLHARRTVDRSAHRGLPG